MLGNYSRWNVSAAFSPTSKWLHGSPFRRQFDSGYLSQALRGHSFSHSERDCSANPSLGGDPSDRSGPSVHHGPEQCPRGCPVWSQPDSGVRVDTQDGGLRRASASMAGHDRPVCHLSQSPLLSLFLSLPGSPGSRHRCSTSQLGSLPGVCLPSLGPDSPDHPQAPLIQGRSDDAHSSLLAPASVVPGPSRSSCGSSGGSASVSISSQPAAFPSLPSRAPQAVSSCLATIQRFARAAGFSSAVASQVGLARRRSSRVNYQLKWSLYRDWCRPHGHSVSRPSLPEVADFLLWLRRSKGLSVSSILGYRPMLSAVFRSVLPGISSDPVIKHLLRSFKVETPPRPLRPPAWDLSMVLRYLVSSSFEPLNQSSLRSLTKKTLFLLALATAERVGELQALSAVVSFVRSDACVSYVPEFVAMESLSNPLPRSFLGRSLSDFAAGLVEHLLLCPVRALRFYLQRTASFSPRPRRLCVTSTSFTFSVQECGVILFERGDF